MRHAPANSRLRVAFKQAKKRLSTGFINERLPLPRYSEWPETNKFKTISQVIFVGVFISREAVTSQ